MRLLFLTSFFLVIFQLPTRSQDFEWQVGFDGFLDNREYFSIDNPQTIFGSRARGEIGASLSGVHRIRFGMNYLYEFGHTLDAHSPDITMYYQYKDNRFNFLMGAFPRIGLLHYPIALLSDTLHYYRPSMEGAYLGVRGNWGYQNLFIDWTSRQTDRAYERFIFGFSGRLQKGIISLNHHVIMGHFAGRGLPDPDFHLRDNGGFHIDAGIDLSEKVFLDSLSCNLGALVSLDRIRGIDDGWQTPAGFMGQFTATYRWFGINGLYYRGQGHTFLYGDPFYRLKQYGRLDIHFMPFKEKPVNLKFNFVFHFANGQLDYSQQILLSLDLHGSRSLRSDNP